VGLERAKKHGFSKRGNILNGAKTFDDPGMKHASPKGGSFILLVCQSVIIPLIFPRRSVCFHTPIPI